MSSAMSSVPSSGASSDSDVAIAVEHAVKRFGDRIAVDDISFTVPRGETLGLLGANGAGKSTLIRLMTTLVPLTSGHIRIAGHDVTTDPDGARRAIGVVPQALTSDQDLSVEENLTIYAKLYSVPAAVRRARIAELLDLVHLSDRRDSLVGTLSGGMRRRVELARGLVHAPEILFLDEPTTGLDPVSRTDVWDLINRTRQAHDLTLLLTTHYMDEAERLCDRIAMMDRGRLVALDTPAALMAAVPGGASSLDEVFVHFAGRGLSAADADAAARHGGAGKPGGAS